MLAHILASGNKVDVHIRPERHQDETEVASVVRAAFGERGVAVAALMADLRRSITATAGLSLVAEDRGRILGHVMFSASLLDAPRRLVPVQVLSPVSVLPDSQRHGVGTELIRHGLELLDARFVPVVFVEGDPAYYGRFGFRPGAGLGYRRPSLRIPEPAFQAIQLANHEPWMTGTLVYSCVFWEHDAVGLRDAP